MESVLQKLYNGMIYPYEMIQPKSAEYHKICHDISAETDYWEQKLDAKEYNRLDDLVTLLCEQSHFDCAESYISGYRLATRIALEVFSKD